MEEHQHEKSPAFSKPAIELMHTLDRRTQESIRSVETSEFWQAMVSPGLNPTFGKIAMREVCLEIFSYQHNAIEGAINAIARMPRSLPIRMLKAMLRHQAEEFDHGEMALRDYVALGGDETYARTQHRPTPAANAVSAIWRWIGAAGSPFAYLGALYPFEGITPIVSAIMRDLALQRGIPKNALEFVTFHADEDPKHTELVRHLIQETATRFPESIQPIQEGLEYFLSIYPMPVWKAAFERARRLYPAGDPFLNSATAAVISHRA